MNNNIFPIKNEQIPAAAAVERQCLDTAWSEKAIEAFIASDTGVYLCAEADGKLAGILSATLSLGEAEIENIAVLPTFRRRGVGNALVAELKKRCNKIFLLVNETNGGALSFYTSLGFEKVGVRKRYYRQNDAFIMELKVK